MTESSARLADTSTKEQLQRIKAAIRQLLETAHGHRSFGAHKSVMEAIAEIDDASDRLALAARSRETPAPPAGGVCTMCGSDRRSSRGKVRNGPSAARQSGAALRYCDDPWHDRKLTEEEKLVEFFRSEDGDALGRQGDHDNLSPAETAIRAMRYLRSIQTPEWPDADGRATINNAAPPAPTSGGMTPAQIAWLRNHACDKRIGQWQQKCLLDAADFIESTLAAPAPRPDDAQDAMLAAERLESTGMMPGMEVSTEDAEAMEHAVRVLRRLASRAPTTEKP